MTSTRCIQRRAIAAFSLIEIVLAVGIVSFALVGILGLFPVALEAAADSRQETQATFIADQIISGLSSPAPFLPSATGTKLGTSVDVQTNGSLQTLYFNDDGEQIGTGANALYEAHIRWTADQPSSGLTTVDLSIVTPAGLPAGANATQYPFVALIRQALASTTTPVAP